MEHFVKLLLQPENESEKILYRHERNQLNTKRQVVLKKITFNQLPAPHFFFFSQSFVTQNISRSYWV